MNIHQTRLTHVRREEVARAVLSSGITAGPCPCASLRPVSPAISEISPAQGQSVPLRHSRPDCQSGRRDR